METFERQKRCHDIVLTQAFTDLVDRFLPKKEREIEIIVYLAQTFHKTTNITVSNNTSKLIKKIRNTATLK